jgi:hypothetical protein
VIGVACAGPAAQATRCPGRASRFTRYSRPPLPPATPGTSAPGSAPT